MTTLASETFTGSNGAAWPAQWTTSAGNGGTATFTIQGNAGQWLGSTAGTYPQAYIAMSSISDCDLWVDFKATTNAVTNYLFFGICCSQGSWSASDPFFPNSGYGVQVTVATSAASSGIQIYRVSGGSYTAGGSAATITVTAGSWYTVRLQRRGSTIKAWFYAQGAAEPGTPTVTFTDGTPLGSGGMVLTGSPASTTQAQLLDNVTVGDGSTAPSYSGSLAVAGSGSLSLSGGVGGSMQRAGSGALTLAQTAASAAGTMGRSGSGAVTFTPTFLTQSGALSRSGAGTLALTGSPRFSGGLTFAGSGALTLNGRIAFRYSWWDGTTYRHLTPLVWDGQRYRTDVVVNVISSH